MMLSFSCKIRLSWRFIIHTCFIRINPFNRGPAKRGVLLQDGRLAASNTFAPIFGSADVLFEFLDSSLHVFFSCVSQFPLKCTFRINAPARRAAREMQNHQSLESSTYKVIEQRHRVLESVFALRYSLIKCMCAPEDYTQDL